MDLTLDISEISNHQKVATELLQFAGTENVFLFDAQMGAGKTTFIKALCLALGVKDTMSSPTYSIVNEYITDSGKKIYHFDFYRVKSKEELFDMGFYDYLVSGNYVFIEWPQLAEDFLDTYLRIIIKLEANNRYLYALK